MFHFTPIDREIDRWIDRGLWSSAVPWLDRELRCSSWNLLEPLSQVHRSPLALLPSLPASFVALPLTLGIFRASHVAEVAVTWGSLDLTTPQSFAVATFTPVFMFGRLAASIPSLTP